ncbi:aldehyde dehydrogenase [Micromonospora inyonensis]|uniref:Gamma-glutamyl-gamma-aminobutyraldehyde dehydrogenase n=1 Tax=Micromonospora inyonensis TaxID=47866 RepID=A0A1C6RJW7_9ACTN|nr:aldehyde dehydrogenase [Micromonospora inyonensis]SCL17440.1 gamma-glutamyl-gamma-aminobutyraldehyde dehydrogenase [Micromonospora inyonensis]
MSSATTDEWYDRALAQRPEGRAFIDGAYVETASGRTYDTITPLSGLRLTAVADGDGEDIDRAVRAARRAHDRGQWADAHPRDRKRVLHRFTDLLLEHQDELALLITTDMGKPISDARREIESSARELRFFAESVDKVYGDVAPTAPYALGMVTREPAGVVGAITPWNFPVMMPVYKLGPALAAGNAVVLKPAEQSALAAVRLAALASEAGLPDGVLNVVPGGPAAGEHLARHLDVDVLTFTGSTEVGKRLLVYSGESNMKPVWLECGGKSPNIVLADAPDLDVAARAAAEGIFHGAGEVCNAGSRLLVEDAVFDEVVGKVVEESAHWQPRDALDPTSRMGPLVDQRQLDRVMSFVEEGRASGIRLETGGRRTLEETGGYYLEPTIFSDVDNASRLAQEEIFGPVLSVVRLSSAQEAVELGNATVYGLAAAVWTSDVTRAFTIARQLKAGTVYVNCYDKGDNSLPFGGYKQSGIGADRSLHAMDKYTNLKTLWVDLSQHPRA